MALQVFMSLKNVSTFFTLITGISSFLKNGIFISVAFKGSYSWLTEENASASFSA